MPTINGKACVIDVTPVDKVFSDGKQVYGKNLLPNTLDYSSWYKPMSLTLDKSVYPYVIHYPSTEATSADDFLQYQQLSALVAGTTYTFTFMSKGSGNLSVYIYPAVSDAHPDNYHQYVLTSSYQKYSFSFVASKTISGTKTVLFRNNGNTLEAYITQVKLEAGNTSSPWTPAPEDVM